MAGKHFSVKVGEGSRVSSREPTSGLSAAGIVIGVIGCVIITASSVYTALKMGALPWPTIFTSVTALVLLRALGHRSLNEANATQKRSRRWSPALWARARASIPATSAVLVHARNGL